MRLIAVLAAVATIITPISAAAAPFILVDATTDGVGFMDIGSLSRNGDNVDVDIVMVAPTDSSRIARTRFDCAGLTLKFLSTGIVRPDGSTTRREAANSPPTNASGDTIGASLLQKACFNRLVIGGSGASVNSLAEALSTGKAVLSAMK